MGRRQSRVTLEGHQLLQHSEGWTWPELAVCSWTAIIPCVWPRLQLTDSSTPLSAPTFGCAGSTTQSLIGASYRKNSICAPPRRMKHSEQLPPPASRKQRAALCHFWGSRREGIQPGSLSTGRVSINCNSNLFLWKLTLNWKQHSFASSTQFL